MMETYREGQDRLRCVFIDLEKACDRVPREEVWNCLRLKELNEKYIRIIQDMHENCTTRVICAAGDIDGFHVNFGLHQGSALSPFLFATIIDCMIGEIQRKALWDTLFDDDVVLCGQTREEIEGRFETWRGEMENRGMQVSRAKTEYLCLNKQDEAGTIQMQEVDLNRVQQFK